VKRVYITPNRRDPYDDSSPYNYERRPKDYYDEYPTDLAQQRYISWGDFRERLPFNAQLLIHLFGERDAIDCHMGMQVVPEVKAATLCSFFSAPKKTSHRLKKMSDS